MIRWLTYRCLGISFWVYLLGLVLAGLMFWVLPASAAVYRWTVDGMVDIRGFADDGSIAVLAMTLSSNREVCYHKWRLDIRDGSIREMETTYQGTIHRASRSQFVLKYTQTFFEPPELELVLGGNTVRTLQLSATDIEVAHMYAANSSSKRSTNLLSSEGLVAISANERYLILLQQQVQPWYRITNWLEEKWNWKFSFLPYFRHRAVVLDLETEEERIVALGNTQSPEYAISPDGKGFLVVDMERNTLGSPVLTQGCTSRLTWYSLPVGNAVYSCTQWYVIATAFLLPVTVAWWRLRCRLKRSIK